MVPRFPDQSITTTLLIMLQYTITIYPYSPELISKKWITATYARRLTEPPQHGGTQDRPGAVPSSTAWSTVAAGIP
eukprot:6195011-Pleurochrysis_carterae.AAC.3